MARTCTDCWVETLLKLRVCKHIISRWEVGAACSAPTYAREIILLRSPKIIQLKLVLAPLILLLLFWIPIPAGAQSGGAARSDPSEVKAKIQRILNGAEFQPEQTVENPFASVLKWLGEQWSAFWKWLSGLFRGLSVPGVGGTSTVLPYTVIAIFIVFFAWLIAKILKNYSFQRAAKPKSKGTLHLTEDEVEMVREPDVWLQQAEQFAAQKDYHRAFRSVYIAILLQLDRAGAVQYERSRTNGEYLRFLSGKRLLLLLEALQPLTGEFDTRWYGTRETLPADYERVLAAYRQMPDITRRALADAAPSAPRSAALTPQTGRA